MRISFPASTITAIAGASDAHLLLAVFYTRPKKPIRISDDPEVRDITNEKFWRKLQSIFRSTAELLAEWAAETGVDLNSIDVSAEMAEQERKIKRS